MNKHVQPISEFIHTAPGFQYSINLKYDLQSVEKIQNYIATSSAMDIIEDILLSVSLSSNDRARLLIGPYGKGKSHLVLIIIALLYYKDKELFINILDKIQKYNEDLYKLALKIIEDKEKILPVIISGNSLNLNQSFLAGLKNALLSEELVDIMPNTYFNAAIDMINVWKNRYQVTYEKFRQMINVSIEEFLKGLEGYNQDFYNKFIQIYPSLTSGGEFNPLQGIDVVEIYSDVASKIKDKGYKGIFVIYDEFSKFLEGSIDRNSAMEIKMLQDFAEKCNRSADKQIHIMLISHKNISNYVDRLPKEKVDAWKAVGDRYKTIEINNLSNQMYEIMSHVIIKERNSWERFISYNQDKFNSLILEMSRNAIFSELGQDLENTVVYGGYPLHPITTYILPKISEKVAQNERTIFTFLSTRQQNTLGHFLMNNKNDFPLMTPDYIYNYFETLFKKENYTSEIYKIWRDTTNALKKIGEKEKIEEKIIKCLGLIYIVGEFQKLPPTFEIIKLILSSTIEQGNLDTIIDSLLQRKILYHIKSKGYLKFIEATDVDVNALISDTIEKRKNLFSNKKVLNDNFYDNYIYATAYNDEHEIIRYFDFEFIEYRELAETSDWEKKIECKISDGIVYAVLIDNEENLVESKKIIRNIHHERIVFILPNQILQFKSLLQKYDAIEYLIGKNQYENQDKLLHEELNVHLDDVKEQILNYLDIFLKPELGAATYYYIGKEQKINRKSLLSRLISEICEKVYSHTPVIINELINKNEPTTVAINNRRKVLDGLLQNKVLPRLGLVGYGQDVTIMQSTLVVTGILREEADNEENKAYLCTKGLEPKIQNVIDTIRTFLIDTSKNGRMTFDKLYDKLTKPKWHIGLKKGIIPIYIAVLLHEFKKYAVISRNGYEMEITGRLLDDINDKPEEFEIYIENWDEQKEKYIQGLENIFKEYIVDGEKEYNTFEYIVRAIYRWFLQLPKYTKEYRKVYLGSSNFDNLDTHIIKLRNSLKGTRINSRDFLFDKLFKIFGYEDFNTNIILDIKQVKITLDNNKKYLIEHLALDIKKIFMKHYNEQVSLYSVMKDWYEGLDNYTKNNLFNLGEEKFLQEIKNITNDYISFIEKISKIITGLRVEDWNDQTIDKFINEVKKYKENIEKFNEELQQEGNEKVEQRSYKISFFTENGEEKTKTFEKVKLSDEAELMYNEIESIFDGYGESIDISEKRQILMKIFEKCC
ncbi:hypothetical protein FQB35_03655 [Crassaminicella thermophila]|uniref:Uncharacterized protein n=1 Tax=Crassaminicella thermophila TaxID=2599308 RepID=A0A5C0SBK0_CRATE|nr:hypothetical protein [Crassaminicella thermophila]QEK11541.1 hypothetical protein FQB35_03655 [Crassaminicella thermophila]